MAEIARAVSSAPDERLPFVLRAIAAAVGTTIPDEGGRTAAALVQFGAAVAAGQQQSVAITFDDGAGGTFTVKLEHAAGEIRSHLRMPALGHRLTRIRQALGRRGEAVAPGDADSMRAILDTMITADADLIDTNILN